MFTRSVLLVLISSVTAFGAVEAGTPQPIIIETHVIFTLPEPVGTFTATAPLCATGTFKSKFVAQNPSVTHAWAASAQYTCDDNSGTFQIKFFPSGAPSTAYLNSAFNVAGPWSVFGKGTGRYSTLSGHGDFGVIFDFTKDPFEGTELFIGFVQLD
jgi:hypothetical protein